MTKSTTTVIALFLLFCTCFICSCVKRNDKIPATTPHFDSIVSRAELIFDSGHTKQAIEFIVQAHAHANNLTLADEMNYYVYTGEYYRRGFSDYDKYAAYADSIILALEDNNQTRNFYNRYAQAYNMKADALFAKGLYDESYFFYFKAKKIAEDNADSCSLSQYSYSLGMALFRQQKYIESARYFMESYTDADKCTDDFLYFYRKQELLDNIGLCFNRAQNYDSAMIFYNKAIAYIDSNYMRFDKKEDLYIGAKAVVYGNMADVFLARKDYLTGESMLKKSININLQKGYTNSDALIDQVKLADLYFKTDKPSEMYPTLVDIKAELDSIPDKKVEESWDKLMWNYYDLEKDYTQAYKYLVAYERMNDSFATGNKSLMSTDVDERIKNIEKQYKIRLLNKDNEQEKISLVIAIIIALMAIIIIFLILKNASKSKKNIEALFSLNNQVNDQKEKLEHALAELELKDKDKSRILRSVAHDIMNPIAAIMSLTDILVNESENFTQDQKEMLSLIKQACVNSLNLSKDILETARTIEKTKSDIPKEWVNINDLVANCVELLSFSALAKKQHIHISSSEKNIQVYVNKEKIWRIINNLISNAIKFSYRNSDIQIGVEQVSEHVHIIVRDNGMGISEKNKSHIFEMFTEAKTAGTSGEAPHGLGLSISLQFARAHNGNLWFESEEGKGTTFHLEFPVNSDNK